MSDVHNAGNEPAPIVIKVDAGDKPAFSVSEAARALSAARHARPKEAGLSAEQVNDIDRGVRAVTAAPIEQESPAQAEDAAPAVEQPSGEDQQAEPAEQLPPIEPPRFWTKDAKERWASLPRETQEYLAEREQARDREVRRGQNEAAEQRKTLEAERQKVEQARQQYESALPILHGQLQAIHGSEFADIRTVADVERLAREDWPRYLQWDLSQKKIAAAAQEIQAAHTRQDQDRKDKFAEYARTETARLLEKLPDMADAKKAEAIQKSAITALKAIGFDETELAQAWTGQRDIPLQDHRMQLLIRDAALWREMQAKAKTKAAQPAPQVLRPGAARPKGEAALSQIQNLNQRLEKVTGTAALRAGMELLRAKRAAR